MLSSIWYAMHERIVIEPLGKVLNVDYPILMLNHLLCDPHFLFKL